MRALQQFGSSKFGLTLTAMILPYVSSLAPVILREGSSCYQTWAYVLGMFSALSSTCQFLNLFSYRPGQVIAFRSHFLYHAIKEWFPTKQQDDLTPGRVSWVFFTYKDVVDAAEAAMAKSSAELAELLSQSAQRPVNTLAI